MKKLTKLDLLEAMTSSRYSWFWLPIISKSLPALIDDSRFLELIGFVSSKIGGGVWSENFWDGLVRSATDDPNVAKRHIKVLEEDEHIETDMMIAAFIEGIGAVEPEYALKAVERLISPGSRHQAAGLWAINTCYRRRVLPKERLISLLFSWDITSDPNSIDVFAINLEAIHADNPDAAEGRLLEILPKLSPLWLERLAHTSDSYSLSFRKNLLETLKNQNDQKPQFAKALLLASIYKNDKEFVLKFLLEILTTPHWYDLLDIASEQLFLEEMGKIECGLPFDRIEGWIGTMGGRLDIRAPEALEHIFRERPDDLVDRIHNWDSSKPFHLKIRLIILRDLITKELKKDASPLGEKWAKEMFAIAKDLNIKFSIRGKNKKQVLYEARKVVHTYLNPVGKIDYDLIAKNMNMFPNIVSFMGRAWFEEKRKEGKEGNYLLTILSSDLDRQIDEEKRIMKAAFSFLDKIFGQLLTNRNQMASLKEKLNNDSRSADFIPEVEIAGLLMSKFEVVLDPVVKGCSRKSDIQATISGQSLLIEVYNPQTDNELKYSSEACGIDIHRMRDRIIKDKFTNQYKDFGPDFKMPVVLALHKSGFSILPDEIETALFGSPWRN